MGVWMLGAEEGGGGARGAGAERREGGWRVQCGETKT